MEGNLTWRDSSEHRLWQHQRCVPQQETLLQHRFLAQQWPCENTNHVYFLQDSTRTLSSPPKPQFLAFSPVWICFEFVRILHLLHIHRNFISLIDPLLQQRPTDPAKTQHTQKKAYESWSRTWWLKGAWKAVAAWRVSSPSAARLISWEGFPRTRYRLWNGKSTCLFFQIPCWLICQQEAWRTMKHGGNKLNRMSNAMVYTSSQGCETKACTYTSTVDRQFPIMIIMIHDAISFEELNSLDIFGQWYIFVFFLDWDCPKRSNSDSVRQILFINSCVTASRCQGCKVSLIQVHKDAPFEHSFRSQWGKET